MSASEHDIFEAAELLRKINENDELRSLELDGFIRGIRKGKTMDVDLSRLRYSLRKQMGDYESKWIDHILGEATKDDLKRYVADIRNVAGIIFLKLCEKKEGAIKGIGKLFEESE